MFMHQFLFTSLTSRTVFGNRLEMLHFKKHVPAALH